MRLLTAAVPIIIMIVSLSCTPPTETVYVTEEPIQEPEPEPETETEAPSEEPETEEPPEKEPEPVAEPEPVWQPDPGTLYLFYDEPGGELYFSEKPDPDSWSSRYRAFRLTAEQFDYIFVAGEPPEDA